MRADEILLTFLRETVNDSLIKIESGECYLQPSIQIEIKSDDDEVLKEKWVLIRDALKLFPTMGKK